MKKLITTVILAAVVVSCNKAGDSSSTAATGKLENDNQKAGYAYGMNVGDQVLNYSASLKEDSLNYDMLEKGLNDYLKMDKKDRESYASGQNIGMSISNFLKTQKLEGIVEEKYIVQGLMDVLKKKTPLFPKDSINSFMQKYMMDNVAKMQKANTEKGDKFLAEKKKDSKVKSTASGLLYEVVQEGTGAMPNKNSVVEVNYVGKTIDGKTFDESKKGKPIKFPLANVIPGWQEGLQLMKVGSKYKLYIPSSLAYGENGSPDGSIAPNEVLVFDVELVSVEEAPANPQGQTLTPEQLEAFKQQMQAQQGK